MSWKRGAALLLMVMAVAVPLSRGQPAANAYASLQEVPEFSMFVQALKGSELHVSVGNTLFVGTIFVPSNLAILNTSSELGIPADKLLSGTAADLRRIVGYHIVPETAYYMSGYYSPNLQDRQRLQTLLPDETLLVDRTSAPGRVLLRGHMKANERVFPIQPAPASVAGITQGDIKAGQAVIHIIDALLVPPPNASALDIPVGRIPAGAAGTATTSLAARTGTAANTLTINPTTTPTAGAGAAARTANGAMQANGALGAAGTSNGAMPGNAATVMPGAAGAGAAGMGAKPAGMASTGAGMTTPGAAGAGSAAAGATGPQNGGGGVGGAGKGAEGEHDDDLL